ncbi:uncharacterized protein LOC141909794 [Tubulanus polymorphus]|uniref:uncharacterized protein LOC141909794 n=1 Tax=Tubulanus polymorphus TaxID=672921 RepID=UPI003DA534EC
MFLSKLRLVVPSAPQSALIVNIVLSRYLSATGTRDSSESSDLELRIKYLSGKLNCTDGEIRSLIQKQRRLMRINFSKIRNITELLIENEITAAEILTYPDVYTFGYDTLKNRVDELHSLQLPFKLLDLKTSEIGYENRLERKLKKYKLTTKFGGKRGLLRNYLKCDGATADKLVEYLPVKNCHIFTVKQKLDFLRRGAGIDAESVRNHPRVLHARLEQLKRRVPVVRNCGLTPQNCDGYFHLLYCADDIFDDLLHRHKREREILADCRTNEEYLRRRLDLDDRSVASMFARYDRLRGMSPIKLEAMLDFLLTDLGQPVDDLVAHPRVLNYSIETLRVRYDKFVEMELYPITIGKLGMDGRGYRKLTEKQRVIDTGK